MDQDDWANHEMKHHAKIQYRMRRLGLIEKNEWQTPNRRIKLLTRNSQDTIHVG